MKVILTQDVPKLGEMGTIQNVADGYARNYLIPQGMANMATPNVVKQVEERQAAEARRIAKLEEEMREIAERIEQTKLDLEVNVGGHGRLFGSITSSDIAERLSEVLGEEIDRRKVELESPIREVGEYKVDVRLVGKLVPKVTVRVYDPDQPELTAASAEGEEDQTEEAQTQEPEAEVQEPESTGTEEAVEADDEEAEETEQSS